MHLVIIAIVMLSLTLKIRKKTRKALIISLLKITIDSKEIEIQFLKSITKSINLDKRRSNGKSAEWI